MSEKAKKQKQLNLAAPFQKGDTVFHSKVSRNGYDVKCPLCNGAKTVTLSGYNHIQEKIDCPYCKRGYEVRGTIHVFDVRPEVRKLTIGSIRYDDSRDAGPWSFMCNETGVGSGFVYDSDDLRLTEDEAMKDATQKACDARAYLEQENLKRFSHNKRDVLLKKEYIEMQALKTRIRELEAENARLTFRLRNAEEQSQ